MAAAEFAPVMGPLAKHFFGEPNRAFSSADEWRYGTKGSLSIDLTAGRWFDHEANEGGGVLDLVQRELKLTGPARLEWLKEQGFLYETHEGNGAGPLARATIVATYDYRDADGSLLFQVVRFDPKDFRQRRPDGDGWAWSVKGVRRVPYRLPELIEAGEHVVFIAEGEKSVDRLRTLGIPATCAPGGAGKWHHALSEFFSGADVVILPDRDPQKQHPKTGKLLFHSDGRPVLPGQDHAQAVAAALTGIAKRVRVLELWHDWPDMPPKADVYDWLGHGGGAEQLYALADGCPDWGTVVDAPPPVPVRSPFPIVEAEIPLRDWIVPGLLLRRNLSVLVAPPASGKSLLTLQLAIAIALGMTWGGWFPRQPEKVLVINSEDDFDEMRRRLVAAATVMRVDQAMLVDRVLLAEAPEDIVIAKIDHRSKAVIRTPLGDKLVTTIIQLGIGVVIADPFVETFEGDENSNSEIKWAGMLWREIARRTATALMLVHHTKKYAGDMAGNQDASRGGGALIGTARIMSTLFNMTEEEAQLFDIAEDNRLNFVRFDDAKSNHSRKGVVRWFEKSTFTINNATDKLPGDDVGVLVPWRPPGLMEGITMDDVTKVLDAIQRGVVYEDGTPTGQRWSPAAKSSVYVGKLIERMLNATEDKARGMIKAWLENGVLVIEDYMDPVPRKLRQCVRVNAEKRPDRPPDVFT